MGERRRSRHGAKHLGHHVLYILRRGEVCRGALQGVGQFFRGAGRRGRDVLLTKGILRGEAQVTARAAIAGDVLAARTGRVQGSVGVGAGFVSCLARDFHFGTPVEGAIGNFWGCPPGVFRCRLGKRQKRKEMGGRVYGKYGKKQWPSSADAAAGKRVARGEKGETRKTKLEIREETEIRGAGLGNGERRGALRGKS